MTSLREKRDNAYHSTNAKLQAGGAHMPVPGACYLGRQAYCDLEHAQAYTLRDCHLRLRLRLDGLQAGHGFRGLASTIMSEQSGFRSEVIELQLAHRDLNKARRACNHAMYLDERKKLMQWWSDYLDEQLEKSLVSSIPQNNLGLAWRDLERWATKKPQSIDLWGFSWHSLELCACILVGSTGTGVFG